MNNTLFDLISILRVSGLIYSLLVKYSTLGIN